ncbi:uncharacterized protein LOC129597792 [Paramacrobiotus metropolitanus]|uniref:uncharacterized protein LOC129597792 n=1 Tax=Paramacrobiotus metropolitanus TaxID=2943436 RepID=UPI0024458481|nr:uncharacterized protein LOC129597792 [Paramacrobiotus metropolitanus]
MVCRHWALWISFGIVISLAGTLSAADPDEDLAYPMVRKLRSTTRATRATTTEDSDLTDTTVEDTYRDQRTTTKSTKASTTTTEAPTTEEHIEVKTRRRGPTTSTSTTTTTLSAGTEVIAGTSDEESYRVKTSTTKARPSTTEELYGARRITTTPAIVTTTTSTAGTEVIADVSDEESYRVKTTTARSTITEEMYNARRMSTTAASGSELLSGNSQEESNATVPSAATTVSAIPAKQITSAEVNVATANKTNLPEVSTTLYFSINQYARRKRQAPPTAGRSTGVKQVRVLIRTATPEEIAKAKEVPAATPIQIGVNCLTMTLQSEKQAVINRGGPNTKCKGAKMVPMKEAFAANVGALDVRIADNLATNTSTAADLGVGPCFPFAVELVMNGAYVSLQSNDDEMSVTDYADTLTLDRLGRRASKTVVAKLYRLLSSNVDVDIQGMGLTSKKSPQNLNSGNSLLQMNIPTNKAQSAHVILLVHSGQNGQCNTTQFIDEEASEFSSGDTSSGGDSMTKVGKPGGLKSGGKVRTSPSKNGNGSTEHSGTDEDVAQQNPGNNDALGVSTSSPNNGSNASNNSDTDDLGDNNGGGGRGNGTSLTPNAGNAGNAGNRDNSTNEIDNAGTPVTPINGSKADQSGGNNGTANAGDLSNAGAGNATTQVTNAPGILATPASAGSAADASAGGRAAASGNAGQVGTGNQGVGNSYGGGQPAYSGGNGYSGGGGYSDGYGNTYGGNGFGGLTGGYGLPFPGMLPGYGIFGLVGPYGLFGPWG